MKALAKEISTGLAFAAIGVAVSGAVVLVHQAQASPGPWSFGVLRGMEPYYGQSCEAWNQFPGYNQCWHDNEIGEYTAIDFNFGPGQTAGKEVRLYFSGFEYFKILAYEDTCKGVRAGIYWGDPVFDDYRGDVHYLHIDVLPDVVGRVTTGPYLPLGHVVEDDNPGCPHWGAHLHQSADRSASTPFYTSKVADPTEGDNWIHAIFWGDGSADSDGDGFVSENELLVRTDPFDGCPDNPSDDAWPPDFDNTRTVDILDVLRFKPVLNSCSGPPYPPDDAPYDPRFDLDTSSCVDVLDVLFMKPWLGESCTP